MKTLSKLLSGLICGAIGLTLAFALMLHFNTAPAVAFAYFLFFLTVQWISTFSFRRDTAIRVVVSSILCLASAFWLLCSNVTVFWEHEYEPGVYSVAWRSAAVLIVLLVIPHLASRLATRSIKVSGHSAI